MHVTAADTAQRGGKHLHSGTASFDATKEVHVLVLVSNDGARGNIMSHQRHVLHQGG